MINGVKIVELKTHEDDRGFFREIFRFSEQFKGVPVGQLSHSRVNEGVIKAWHGHVYQSQWNYVVTGQIKVGLYDNRKDSTTYKDTMEYIVGDGVDPIAYFFPPGVLHGYQCTKGPMHIIYVTSGIYDLEDEIRESHDNINHAISWK
jgi:dTDP-4-dehydrorhamnose 3,5-epimerase